MADNIDPPTPPKNKGGRPKKNKYAPPRYDAKRNYSYSINEAARNRVDPQLWLDWHFMIASGQNPRILLDDDRNPIGLEEDPSPGASPPTLAQRNDSMRVLMERRDGLAPQKIDFTANVQATLPPELMAGLNANTLAMIAQALALPDPNVIDTVGVESNDQGIATDVPSQDSVTGPSDSAIAIDVPDSD